VTGTGTTLANLRLVGTTTASGGQFGNVKITGEAVLAGDTECRNLSCTGNFEVKGNLRADNVKLTGECHIGGSLTARRIQAIGDIQVNGALHGERLKMTGSVRVQGDCNAEALLVSGAITSDGLLNAEEVQVRMHGPSRAEEIGGGVITVKRSRAVAIKSLFMLKGIVAMTANLIEGDTVILEHTRAAVVRGNRVTIGSGCEIGRVEYRGVLEVGGKALVKEKVKL